MVGETSQMTRDFRRFAEEGRKGRTISPTLEMVDVYLARKLAIAASTASQLPGRENGPADAYRHLIWAAEMTRRFGEGVADYILETHEIAGEVGRSGKDLDVRHDPQVPEAMAMDRHNNALGIEIGRAANSYEDVVQMVRTVITSSNPDGSGKWRQMPDMPINLGAGAVWRDEKHWITNPRRGAGKDAPQMSNDETNWYSNPARADGPDWEIGILPEKNEEEYPYKESIYNNGVLNPNVLVWAIAYEYRHRAVLGMIEDFPDMYVERRMDLGLPVWYRQSLDDEFRERYPDRRKEVAPIIPNSDEPNLFNDLPQGAGKSPALGGQRQATLGEPGGTERGVGTRNVASIVGLGDALYGEGSPSDPVESALEKQPEQATDDEAELVSTLIGHHGKDTSPLRDWAISWTRQWRAHHEGPDGGRFGVGPKKGEMLRAPAVWTSSARSRDGIDLDRAVGTLGALIDDHARSVGSDGAARSLQQGLNMLRRAAVSAQRYSSRTVADASTRSALERFGGTGAARYMPEPLTEDGIVGPKTARAARRLISGLGLQTVQAAVEEAISRHAPTVAPPQGSAGLEPARTAPHTTSRDLPGVAAAGPFPVAAGGEPQPSQAGIAMTTGSLGAADNVEDATELPSGS